MRPNRFLFTAVAVSILVLITPGALFGQSPPAFVGRLPCAEASSVLRQGTFRLPVGRVHFIDGQACIKPFDDYRGCEYRVALVRSGTWGPNARHFVVIIEAVHDSPGAWVSAIIYTCRSGFYESVYADSYGPRGGKVVLGSGSTFDVITGEWLANDPGCCPSRERRRTYRWDDRRQRFVLIASKVLPVEQH
jgi:hypothetical protein